MRNKRSLLQDKHIILQQDPAAGFLGVNLLVLASIAICLVGKG